MDCCCNRDKQKAKKDAQDDHQSSKQRSKSMGHSVSHQTDEKSTNDRGEASKRDKTAIANPPSKSMKPTPGEKEVYCVAVSDYTPDSGAELSLKIGDRVRVLEDKGGVAGPDWIFVTRAGDRSGTGYVPKAFIAEEGTLDAEPWYFGSMTRPEAEEILQNSVPGAFLVRRRADLPSMKFQDGASADSLYTLSTKHKTGAMRHYQIWCLADRFGGGYFLSKKRKFATLNDLIEWHKRGDNDHGDFDISEPAKKKPTKPAGLSLDAQRQWREIPRTQITVGKQIGIGHFGVVCEGMWQSPFGDQRKVAIKALKRGSATARNQFIKEAITMKNLSHKNLAQLYGVVSTEEPYWLLQEFVKNGSLLKYLQVRQKRKVPLSERSLINVCAQIACGMCYLEEKSVVHRDLAARNVLVDEISPESLLIKIADFGLAKLILQEDLTPGRRRVKDPPTKWTAPEALEKGVFSSKSDVWSYGIVLHEVFTHGKEPYDVISNAFVRRYVVQARGMLRRNDLVPERVYEEMKKCFKFEPTERPTFKELFGFFSSYYPDGAEKSVRGSGKSVLGGKSVRGPVMGEKSVCQRTALKNSMLVISSPK